MLSFKNPETFSKSFSTWKCSWQVYMKKTQIITEFGVVYISLLVQNINIFWLNNYAAIKKKSAVWQNKHEDFQK